MRKGKYAAMLLAWVLALGLCSAVAAQEATPMQQGIAAFEQGDYAAALRSFLEAEQAGLESESLRYNIAATLYRLGRYEEARRRFASLGPDPRWDPLINYNFGLIAAATGEREDARRYFRLARDQDREPGLSGAAARKLETLAREEVRGGASPARANPSQAPAGLGLLSLSGGSDSNAAGLADEFLQSAPRARDDLLEALGYYQRYVTGASGEGARVYGLVFARRFAEFEHLDSLVYGAGTTLERPLGDYRGEAGLRLTRVRLGDERVADQARLHAALALPSAAGTFEGGYYLDRFLASRRYAQVDGWRHRLELDWERNLAPFSMGLRYRYEINDRQDLRRNGAFSSYSPTLHGLRAELQWRPAPAWRTTLSYEFRSADYAGINRLRDVDGRVKSRRRERLDRLLSLRLSYRLTPRWRLRGEVAREEVDDVFKIYTRERTRVMATMEYQFQ